MNPATPLLHTRLINASIQAFSQLFVYSGSGSRGKMTEVVLDNMGNCAFLWNRSFVADKLPPEERQNTAHNICCILWCIADVGVFPSA